MLRVKLFSKIVCSSCDFKAPIEAFDGLVMMEGEQTINEDMQLGSELYSFGAKLSHSQFDTIKNGGF